MNADRAITVAHSSPYPPVRAEGPNPSYARILSSDLASANGEMTAVCLYLFQKWTQREEYPFIADTLGKIAQVEMLHLDLLGRLLTALGSVPVFRSRRNGRILPWNGNMVSDSRSIRHAILLDITAEERAYEGYVKQSEAIHDPYISALLARIALDEKKHVEILKGFLTQI